MAGCGSSWPSGRRCDRCREPSPRTARRLVRLARAEHGALGVAGAFREGRITLFQVEVLLRGESPEVLETALRVTLRRLEDEVLPRRVAFWAPREVAAMFEALVARVGLEAMLDHAIATWLDGLVYTLGVGRFGSGDVKLETG